jgi:MFS superfamily sulfate permease-like transporter
MKNKYIIATIILVVFVGITIGYLTGVILTLNQFQQTVANKEDINKLLDENYLQGIKDGTHCSVIESEGENVDKDKRCIDAKERMLKM